MSFTFDTTTDLGKVRLLITDTHESNPIFQDNEIEAFLELEEDDIRLAAAQALDTIASSEALVQKRIKLLDLSTDGPAVAKELRERAAELRRQVDEEFDFDWAETVVDQFSAREKVIKEALRDG